MNKFLRTILTTIIIILIIPALIITFALMPFFLVFGFIADALSGNL